MATQTEPLGSAAVERELGRLRLYAPTILNTGSGHRAFMRWIGGIVAFAVAALFLPWQQNVQGTGNVSALSPQDRPQTLPAAIDGQIQEWYVREGDAVKKGQLIARISEVKEDYLDPNVVARTAEQRDAKAAAIGDKRRAAGSLGEQVDVLRRGMALKLEQTRNKIRQYEADVSAAAFDSAQKVNQLERREALFRDGLVDLNSVQSFRLNVQKAAADLAEKRAGLANARSTSTRWRRVPEGDRQGAVGALEDARRRQHRRRRGGEARQQGGVARGAARLLRDPRAAGRLRGAGAARRHRRDDQGRRSARDRAAGRARAGGRAVRAGDGRGAHPRRRPGAAAVRRLAGAAVLGVAERERRDVRRRVAVVDRVGQPDGLFRVLVVEDTTTAGDQRWPRQLRAGSGVYGWTMLREVRVWYEVWRQLNGFPPSVAEPAEGGGKAKDAGAKK
jgi:multidrug efflux pump subunit AcrA (membrane-fusion protein)